MNRVNFILLYFPSSDLVWLVQEPLGKENRFNCYIDYMANDLVARIITKYHQSISGDDRVTSPAHHVADTDGTIQ